MNVSNEKADERATVAGERKIEKKTLKLLRGAGEGDTVRMLASAKPREGWRG